MVLKNKTKTEVEMDWYAKLFSYNIGRVGKTFIYTTVVSKPIKKERKNGYHC